MENSYSYFEVFYKTDKNDPTWKSLGDCTTKAEAMNEYKELKTKKKPQHIQLVKYTTKTQILKEEIS